MSTHIDIEPFVERAYGLFSANVTRPPTEAAITALNEKPFTQNMPSEDRGKLITAIARKCRKRHTTEQQAEAERHAEREEIFEARRLELEAAGAKQGYPVPPPA